MSSLASSCDETAVPVCINDYLHDYCLLYLFDHLPLAELARIDQVCARWNALRWSSLCRRKKLTLIINNSRNYVQESFAIPYTDELLNVIPNWKSKEHYNADRLKTNRTDTSIQWSHLELPEITFETTNWLVRNFRNINSLTISVSKLWFFSTHALKWLLDKWSSNLVSLKLYLGDLWGTGIFRIYGSINSMKVLRHFTLVVAGILQLKPSANLQIVSQLEELNISSHDSTSLIIDLLKNNASNDCRLKRISVASRHYNDTAGSYLSLDDNLAAQFVYLDLHFTLSPYQLHLFCFKFSSLKSIKLTIEVGQSYARLLNCLVQLKQLVCLQLTLDRHYKIPLFLHNEDGHYLQSGKLAQLHSVKTFKLSASIASHEEIAQMELHWTIPNVQVIRINKHQYCCSICQYDDSNDSDDSDDLDDSQNRECARLLTKSLLVCSCLHTIYIELIKFVITCV